MTPLKTATPITEANADSMRVLDLEPVFQQKVIAMLKDCRDQGITMQVTSTVRGPESQAKIWCQSRRPEMVTQQAEALVKVGAPWLAAMLKPEYCKGLPRVTNALPGTSWHQWSEAIDCVVKDGTLAIWNTDHRGWQVYAKAAAGQSLTAGAFWKGFPDFPHVQLRADHSPMAAGFTWPQIEEQMKTRFKQ